jgi:3-(3-hydroxy-phenyl)propionate hydroxylase
MTRDTDVIVIGLGPVGAMLTALLAQRGVRVIAIDRDKDVYPLPRGAHFDHEIMRLFQQLGIADDVLKHARPAPAYEFRSAKGEALLRFELAARASPSGWPPSFMFHQPGMENALRQRIEKSATAEMRLGCKLVSFSEDADGITAKLARDGREETVRARFLVGCDGASSAVRETLGIELSSYDFDEPWLVIDTIPGDVKVPDINLQICDPVRPTTCVLMGPGRHRWEFMLRPGETAEQVLEEKFIRTLLASWGCSDIPIDRKAVYRFHGLVAKQWRKGRTLLAGDSAHQMPPFAGQGMCAGLRDASNLAWKLAAVLRGTNDALLDTYQQEREPHVRATIELAIHMGRVVCTTDPVQAAERDRGMIAARAAGGRQDAPPPPPPFAAGLVSASNAAGTLFPQPWSGMQKLDDVLGTDAWLIARETASRDLDTPAGKLHIRALSDPALAPFAAALSAFLKTQDGEAVLVRPDRYVFGTGNPEALLRTLEEKCSAAH